MDAKEKEGLGAGPPSKRAGLLSEGKLKTKQAGWVARTRPLAEPLSPRGPQPVLKTLRLCIACLNGSAEPLDGVPGL